MREKGKPVRTLLLRLLLGVNVLDSAPGGSESDLLLEVHDAGIDLVGVALASGRASGKLPTSHFGIQVLEDGIKLLNFCNRLTGLEKHVDSLIVVSL